MFENKISPRAEGANLKSHDRASREFSWDAVQSEFSWHATGRLNIAHEAVDRHAADPAKAHRPCLIYANEGKKEIITFKQMSLLANRFGNVLRKFGVGKGDRVFIFLPSTPELYIALAGCAKIGAVIVPLYSNLRETAVKERMLDGRGKVIVTTASRRAQVPADEFPDLERVIIVGPSDDLDAGEVSWNMEIARASELLETAWVDREHPLFLVYTSGQDGRPAGLLHVHDAMSGYLMTARWVLDLKEHDILWTQGQPGWLMQVVYGAFAPWLCGVCSFITGRVHTAEEFYRLIELGGVSVVYTIPTVYRLLIDAGHEAAKKFDLSSLRHLLSVVEPLYPDVIYGIMRILGLPVYDTWWTAETGMITLANFLCLPVKPGYLGKPVPGIGAAVFDADGTEVPPFTMGMLALTAGWPAMARGIFQRPGDYERHMRLKPWFLTDDVVFMDYDGYFFHQGRADDVIITSAGKTGFAEIEHALTLHPAVAEAAVIKIHHKKENKELKAFIILKEHYAPGAPLKRKIKKFMENNLSPDLVPKKITFCESLPKDADGNVLRRVLKASELGLPVADEAAHGRKSGKL